VAALGIGTSLIIQQRAQARMTDLNDAIRRQSEQLGGMQASDAALANQDNEANSAAELARLRNEANTLRQTTNELAALREENRQLWNAFSSSAPDSSTAFRAESYARLNYSRAWMMAFMIYAQANNHILPTNFAQAGPFFASSVEQGGNAEVGALAGLLTNQFEVVFSGADFLGTNAGSVAVIRETLPRQSDNGKWIRIYAFADGHSEGVGSPDGDFSQWESQHLVAPIQQK
jgi:hypothetical protein